MNWLLIIGIIIIVMLVISVFFHLLKLALKTLGALVLIAIAVFAVLGILIYFDAADFQENFGDSDNIYLLRDDDTVLAGFVLNNAKPKDIAFLETPDLIDHEEKIQEENYSEVLGENYKLIIIEMEIIENSTTEFLVVKDVNISKDFAIALLESNTPRDDLVNHISAESGRTKEAALQKLEKEGMTSDAVVKDQIFAMFLSIEFSEGSTASKMIRNVKESKAYIYPKKFLFTLTGFIPTRFIEKITEMKDGEE